MAVASTATNGHSSAAPRRRKFAEDGVFGMALFVFTETMLFIGFISAFIVAQNGAPTGLWPPPDQPRLPVAGTAMNTLALLASGVCLYLAQRRFQKSGPRSALGLMGAAFLLGLFFVVFQGIEWTRLIAQGLTLTSSQLGSFFYVIVGAHALHAIGALVFLGLAWRSLRAQRLTNSTFGAVQLFWYFVVLMWPIIYFKVYL